MRKLTLLILVTIFLGVHAPAQDYIKKVEGRGIHTNDELHVNKDGEYYAKPEFD